MVEALLEPLAAEVGVLFLGQALDRPVSIGRIALNPYTLNLEADRVRIGEHGGNGEFFDVERLVVRPSWTSLFRLAPIVDEVRLDSPHLWIVRFDAQRFNFTDLIQKFASGPSKPGGKPTLFSVSNIRIENGRIDFDDRLIQGQTNKSGAVYLYDRKELKIRSMIKKRENFREEIVGSLYDT